MYHTGALREVHAARARVLPARLLQKPGTWRVVRRSVATRTEPELQKAAVAGTDRSRPQDQQQQQQQQVTSPSNCQTAIPDVPVVLAVETQESRTGSLLPPAAVLLGTAGTLLLAAANQDWVSTHQAAALGGMFLLGYAAITVEEVVGLDKAATSLLMAVALWTTRALALPADAVHSEAAESLGEVSEVLFFLLGAMAVVEVVDANGGFRPLASALRTNDLRRLAWALGAASFLLSAVLDNLTATIVMVSILQRLCPDPEAKKLLGAVVVIAANAGGAWTPIGDVTTTMLWIGGQLTPVATMQSLLLPSIMALVVPLAAFTRLMPELAPAEEAAAAGGVTDGKGSSTEPQDKEQDADTSAKVVGAVGLLSLLGTPVFRAATGLPPYMGVLGGLAALWALTDALHPPSNRDLRVAGALQRVDIPGVLFFLGVLMSVAALEHAGVLQQAAVALDASLPSREALAACLGLVSAVVDNVPLVAASMGMYSMAAYPTDSSLWQMVAYCAGTGGSMLVVGSAAGVAYMGLVEGVSFGWYLRRVAPWALLGYGAGFGVYLLQSQVAAGLVAAGLLQ